MGRRLVTLFSPEETIALGKQISTFLKPNDVIAIEGGLGAGKTHLVKGIAIGLGLAMDHEVQSPTFVYLACYATGIPLYHFDLYRLACSDEFCSAGFEEYLYKGGITVIEWPKRIFSILPSSTQWISLSFGEESDCRVASYSDMMAVREEDL